MCDVQNIHRYYDNELSPAQRAEVESHLASCAECAAELEHLRSISAMMSRVPHISQIALARIHRSIDAMNERMILRLVSRMTAVAAMILLAGTVWLSVERTTSEEQQAASVTVPTTWENAAVSMNADPSPDVQMSSFVLAADSGSGSNQ